MWQVSTKLSLSGNCQSEKIILHDCKLLLLLFPRTELVEIAVSEMRIILFESIHILFLLSTWFYLFNCKYYPWILRNVVLLQSIHFLFFKISAHFQDIAKWAQKRVHLMHRILIYPQSSLLIKKYMKYVSTYMKYHIFVVNTIYWTLM